MTVSEFIIFVRKKQLNELKGILPILEIGIFIFNGYFRQQFQNKNFNEYQINS